MKYFFFVAGILFAAVSYADSSAAQYNRDLTRLIPLEKVTVGPDDQYNGAVDPTGQTVVFTHKADLVAHLDFQNLKSGEVVELLPPDADSEEPSFSPDGRLAFTYFKYNSRGDICWIKLPSQIRKDSRLGARDIHCLARSGESSHRLRGSPAWKSADEIVFLEQSANVFETRIVSVDLRSGRETDLVKGQVWSPDLRAGGRYLTFNELSSDSTPPTRRVALLDLQTGKRWSLHLDLPGLSGFPRLAEDERYLYFSHFMEDTNADQTIDGKDNAVIFRLPIATVVASKDKQLLFPEQLTPVENGCSFPRPALGQLFATCLFEGSLDVYKIPTTGIVPTTWTTAKMQNMLANARSYEDRVLLHNVSKYRFPLQTRGAAQDFDEEMLSDHFMSEDFAAALYYLQRLETTGDTADADFHFLLRQMILGLSLKKTQPNDENISREFAVAIEKLIAQVDKSKSAPLASQLVAARLKLLLLDWSGADVALKRALAIGFVSKTRPMEYGIYHDVADTLERHEDGQTKSTDAKIEHVLKLYGPLLAATSLSEPSRMFYGFHLLARLQELKIPRAQRISAISSIAGKYGPQLASLFNSEVATLRIIEAKTDPEKLKIYPELDKIMSATRADTPLRRALYVRAIINFSEAAEFKYMSFVGNTWLRYTDKSDTEFSYAREVFTGINFDQAYDALGQGKFLLADNYFLTTLNATDDLESHFGYISAVIREGKRAALDATYKRMVDHKQLGDSILYVQALLGLLDRDAKRKDPRDVSELETAIAKLGDMNESRNSTVRYLLLGYCQMEKMLRLANGVEIDNQLFQEANHNLLLSYDLGRDNDRVKAAALMDLGILHQRAQNYGQSAKYFALRDKLGFDSDHDRAAMVWLWARSMEHSHLEPDAALAFESLPSAIRVGPIEEREALAFALDEKFKEARDRYQALLSSKQVTGDLNLAKINLALGYVLCKLKANQDARTALIASLDHSRRLHWEKRRPDQSLDFDPRRMQLSALGMLAQVGTPAEKSKALQDRWELLGHADELLDDVPGLKIQNRLQLAAMLSGSDAKAAAALLDEASDLASKYGEKNGYMAKPVTETVTDYLAYALRHPELYRGKDKAIEPLVQAVVQASFEMKTQPVGINLATFKIQLFWSAFSKRTHAQNASAEAIPKLMSSENGKRLREDLSKPEWAQLEKLAESLSTGG